jgi:hypothetical protein
MSQMSEAVEFGSNRARPRRRRSRFAFFLSGTARFVSLAHSERTENDDEHENDLGVLEDPPHPAKLFVALVQKALDRFLFQLIEMRQERRPQTLRG